jgi:hypothetical protein
MNTEISDLTTIEVGEVSFGLDYAQANNAILGPNDGSPTLVGNGWVWNTGNVNLAYHSGGVDIVDVNDGGLAACDMANFGGTVVPLVTLALPSVIGVGEGSPDPLDGDNGHFDVTMFVANGAPDACQGTTVDYVVFVTMQTTGG